MTSREMAVLDLPNAESGRISIDYLNGSQARLAPSRDSADTGAGQPDGILEVSPIQTRPPGRAARRCSR